MAKNASKVGEDKGNDDHGEDNLPQDDDGANHGVDGMPPLVHLLHGLGPGAGLPAGELLEGMHHVDEEVDQDEEEEPPLDSLHVGRDGQGVRDRAVECVDH